MLICSAKMFNQVQIYTRRVVFFEDHLYVVNPVLELFRRTWPLSIWNQRLLCLDLWLL